jgi:hypothetical protein
VRREVPGADRSNPQAEGDGPRVAKRIAGRNRPASRRVLGRKRCRVNEKAPFFGGGTPTYTVTPAWSVGPGPNLEIPGFDASYRSGMTALFPSGRDGPNGIGFELLSTAKQFGRDLAVQHGFQPRQDLRPSGSGHRWSGPAPARHSASSKLENAPRSTPDPFETRGDAALKQRPVEAQCQREIAPLDHLIGLLGRACHSAERNSAPEDTGLGARH